MEWNLEDLFAEPPPKVNEDAWGVSHDKDLLRNVGDSKEAGSNMTSVCPTGCEKVQDDYCGLTDSPKSNTKLEGYGSLEVGEKKTIESPQRYHVPKLEDILASSNVHSNKRRRTHFDVNNDCIYFKEYQNSVNTAELVSHKPAEFENKDIREAFKEQFKQKDSKHKDKKPANCMNGLLGKNSDTCSINSIDDKFEAWEGGNVNKGHKQHVSKRKKAGNYDRKLHTKCRISAKEIMKVAGQQNEDYQDFFGDISERSMELATFRIANTANAETNNAFGNSHARSIMFTGSNQTNTKRKIAHQKSKKKLKKRKGRDRLHKIAGCEKEDVHCDVNSDDIILSSEKQIKPHKWPVCKQVSRNEGMKQEHGTAGTSEQKNDTKTWNAHSEQNSKLGNETEERKVGVKNSVLDSILDDVSYLDGMMNDRNELYRQIEHVISSDNEMKRLCEKGGPYCINKLSIHSLLELVKSADKNLPLFKTLKKQNPTVRTFQCEKDSAFRQKKEKPCLDNISSVSGISQAKWNNAIEKRKLSFGDSGEKSGKQLRISNKNEWTIVSKSQTTNDDKHGDDNDDHNDDHTDANDDDDHDASKADNDIIIDCGSNDDFLDDKSCFVIGCGRNNEHSNSKPDIFLKSTFVGNTNTSGTQKPSEDSIIDENKHINEEIKTKNHKSHISVLATGNLSESLLSNVSDWPIDLSVVGKESEQPLLGKRKRGGKKKKLKKKIAFNKGNTSRIKIEEKAKVQCKFFLEGKCKKGAECRFLHEGLPQRRELCRYYVSNCCLADDCIFMHSEFPCKFFHGFSKCVNGNNCKYSHEPLTEETRKLLDELLARDAALKNEGTTSSSQQNINDTDEELPHATETDQMYPALFSSLISDAV